MQEKHFELKKESMMRKIIRIGAILLIAFTLLTSCRRPVEDPHDHDHLHPWETKPGANSGILQDPTDTPVTGSISHFSVWDASNYAAVSSVQGEPAIRVISSPEQWKSYCNTYYPDLMTKYGSDYFQRHSVVIYRNTENSRLIDLKVIDVLVKQEKLTVIIRRHEPFLQDSIMKNWCLFIEVEGDVLLDADSDVTVEFLSNS
jgi:hypothetical protein